MGELEQWRVFRCPDGAELICELRAGSGTLRVTSPIAQFALALRSLVTASGRRYELIGPAGQGAALLTMMRELIVAREQGGCDDVTAEYQARMVAATH